MTQAETDRLTNSGPGRGPQARRVVRDEAPHDPALPGLQSLLSTEHMGAHLATHLGRPIDSIKDFEISYVRYKPGTNCLVAYRIAGGGESDEILAYGKVYTEGDFDRAKLKEDAHRWVLAPGLPSSLILNKERAILYFFPNDCLLEGLRILSDSKKIQRLLYEWYDRYPEDIWRISDRRLRVTPVRYKPERRAVLRCETRATHRQNGNWEPLTVYMRIYSDERGENNFKLMKTLYEQKTENSDLSLPRPLGYLPARSLLMMEGLPGVPFKEAQADRVDLKLHFRLGSALRAFHTLVAPELDRRSVEEIAAEAFSSAESLAELVPELAAPIREVQLRLKELTPANSDDLNGLVHGDFHLGQAVVSEASMGIIDFDRSYDGDQYADLGELCAHLRLIEQPDGPDSALNEESAFLTGYEEAVGTTLDRGRLKYWTTLRMLSLAVSPFRRLEQHWRVKAREIIEKCSKLLIEK